MGAPFAEVRRGVWGADAKAESSLLEGRSSPPMGEREVEGLEASDRDRAFGDGRTGNPGLSPAESVWVPDSPNSERSNSDR